MSKKTPDTEPTAICHGRGWQAMLKQAEYLEAHPNETHVLSFFDADTGEPGEPIIADNRDDVLYLANWLRETAQIARNARN
jgi:hypothetical protein